jgi:phospholipid N-methyltransferase
MSAPAAPARTSSWRERLAFLQGFLRHPAEVGSVIPSSRWLEQRLVRAAGLVRARVIVELGPGTGGTTRALLRAMPAGARLLAVELSEAFAARLPDAVRDSRLLVRHGSAECLSDFLAELQLPAPDVVVSGIPFSTMPAAAGVRVAAAVKQSLAPGGRFVAYQVRPHVARHASPLLGEPACEWEWRNIPPMRVYTWTRS